MNTTCSGFEQEESKSQYCVSLTVGPHWRDAPNAVILKLVSPKPHCTEFNAGRKLDKPSESKYYVCVEERELLEMPKKHDSVKIVFVVHLTEMTKARWETVLYGKQLYIQVPTYFQPEGSKTVFVSLLTYAEELFKCTDIIVFMKKDRVDRAQLVRSFTFAGFTVIPDGHALIPHDNYTINIYMHYNND